MKRIYWTVLAASTVMLGACSSYDAAEPIASTESQSLGIQGETGSMAGMTEAHNNVRKNVNPAPSTPMPALTWSDTIADVAQKYSAQCQFKHSGGKYGENLYASYGAEHTAADVVKSWADEVADYDYATNSCAEKKVCGHYTQVVWAATTEVGCGTTRCTTNSPFGNGKPWDLWVCNYNPPGNYVGRKPY